MGTGGVYGKGTKAGWVSLKGGQKNKQFLCENYTNKHERIHGSHFTQKVVCMKIHSTAKSRSYNIRIQKSLSPTFIAVSNSRLVLLRTFHRATCEVRRAHYRTDGQSLLKYQRWVKLALSSTLLTEIPLRDYFGSCGSQKLSGNEQHGNKI